MVIDNFNSFRSPIDPDKAHSPSIVDPDAVLTCAVAAKQFQAVSGGRQEVSQLMCLMHLP